MDLPYPYSTPSAPEFGSTSDSRPASAWDRSAQRPPTSFSRKDSTLPPIFPRCRATDPPMVENDECQNLNDK
jgi:hypothetical protein